MLYVNSTYVERQCQRLSFNEATKFASILYVNVDVCCYENIISINRKRVIPILETCDAKVYFWVFRLFCSPARLDFGNQK